MKIKVGLHLFEKARNLAFKYVYLYEIIKEFLQNATLLYLSPITSVCPLPQTVKGKFVSALIHYQRNAQKISEITCSNDC